MEEKKRGTNTWWEVADNFTQCFLFEGKIEPVTQDFQAIKKVFFFPEIQKEDGKLLPYQEVIQKVACQKINNEMNDDNLEDLKHLYFEEMEGERDIKVELMIEGIHLL